MPTSSPHTLSHPHDDAMNPTVRPITRLAGFLPVRDSHGRAQGARPSRPAGYCWRSADKYTAHTFYHRFLTLTFCCLAFLGCSVDHSITHGADGAPEWDRRLRNAVPIGTPISEARAILIDNGFNCDAAGTTSATLECTKLAPNALSVARRRWHARLEATDGRVSRVESSTELLRE